MPYRIFFLLLIVFVSCNSDTSTPSVPTDSAIATGLKSPGNEKYRPQFHFSPKAHWMNDPNGMFYLDGTWNLYFQYYPDGTTWGPMHWGHATSTDLISWKEEEVALFPDSLGYIFSGSAVVDKDNTSGFGKNGKTPIVAIFTHHDPKGAEAKKNNYQVQSLAYSLDKGMTWVKYDGNPVLPNPGIVDFRDPKVNWNSKINQWVMTLATKDRITFYSSPNLKEWTRLSEFGQKLGAHGGVWECPDLFPLDYKGKETWVLLVSINPGGPNGGSATQYFIGDFNGKEFIPSDTTTRFIDYGTDNYAGVTVANTGDRRVFIGWMSNWLYGEKVPTEKWRSAMTIPRTLSLKEAGGKAFLAALPVKETEKLGTVLKDAAPEKDGKILIAGKDSLFRLSFATQDENFEISFSNSSAEKFVIGFDKPSNRFYMDRTAAGAAGFYPAFAARHWAPRVGNGNVKIDLLVDLASVELFADEGLTVMTDIFFPVTSFNTVSVSSANVSGIRDLKYIPIR
ncbi:MAG: glycoside hydrolase family 32 protein [Chitinophagaceae bacterium]|nr:MAG: glycoside hydrolase family 32 protein [Chitinophagaceae bacterium]